MVNLMVRAWPFLSLSLPFSLLKQPSLAKIRVCVLERSPFQVPKQPELVAVMVRVNVDNVDVSSGRAVKYSPEVTAKIEEFTTPYFVRTMYDAMVFNGHRQGGYHMELPAPFVKEHGDKFHRCVTLEGPTGEVWKVRLKVQVSKIQARVSFAAGWREFSRAHELERGDLLLFSVVAESKFVVYLFSQAGELVQRRKTNATVRHRQKFPSRTLRFSDDDSSPSESEPSPPAASPKLKAKRSRQPGSIEKKEGNLKPRANRKEGDSARPKKRRGKILFSETEAFKLLEEVAGGRGTVSHVVHGKLVAWEKVDQDNYSSECVSSPSAIEIPEQSGPSDDPSPGTNMVYDVAEAASWPTWLQLFGFDERAKVTRQELAGKASTLE